MKLSVYESIMERIKREIALGVLKEGDKLSSCRELALEMGINPNTVQRAYSTLEEEGVIFTIPKKGVYVKKKKSDDSLEEAREYLSSLKRSGVEREKLQKLIDEIWEESHD